MRVVGLISGGKDSCYNLMKCVEHGHEIVALVNLYPEDTQKDELDSYMYQTVGHQLIDTYSESIDIPLFRKTITGKPLNLNLKFNHLDVSLNEKDEVEDVYEILKNVKSQIDFDAVSVGAIFSEYQSNRVINVCERLNVEMLAYLWKQNQKELLNNMIKDGLEAVLIKVATIGLDPDLHLGKTIKQMQPILENLNNKYGINICGEGGEYETFTVDCPLFKKKICFQDTQVVVHSNDAFAKVAFLRVNRLQLVAK